jgi:hypothetical protein
LIAPDANWRTGDLTDHRTEVSAAYCTLTPLPLVTSRPAAQRSPDPRQPRAHRLLAILSEARTQRQQRPAPKTITAAAKSVLPVDMLPRARTMAPRDLNFQIQGIRAFISRLECDIATRHGQRAERALTLQSQRRVVEDLEAQLSDLRLDISGQRWLNLVERYNTAKTHLSHLSDLDKRQTAIDLSDDPHMEAELLKWRGRLAQVAPRAA